MLFWLFLLFAIPTAAQIAQDRPDLCGKPNSSVPLPPGISATTSDAGADVTISVDNSKVKIEMAGVDEVQQVCPLPSNRILIFGLLDDRSAYGIALVDLTTGKALDDFLARTPTISPDQRWLAVRRFYPAQSDIVQSESYWLYDLTKDSAG